MSRKTKDSPSRAEVRRTEKEINGSGHPCPDCGMEFGSKAMLGTHVVLAHGG